MVLIQTYPLSNSQSLFWLTHWEPKMALRMSFRLPRISPSDRLTPRKTYSCAYSTECQLRTLTGFPYPCACRKRQS